VPIRLVLVTSGGSLKIIGHDSLLISKEAINEFSLIVEFPEKLLTRRSQPIKIDVFSGNEKIQTIQTTFLGPFI
jgi:hypothetical protein